MKSKPLKSKLLFLYDYKSKVDSNMKVNKLVELFHSLLFYYNKKRERINEREFNVLMNENKNVKLTPILCGEYVIGWKFC